MNATDTKHLRAVFGKFATGVTVVTFRQDESVYGMTVNSFSSVSLNPPKILFCPSVECRFSNVAEIGTVFTISILGKQQKDVCLHFAGRACLETPPWTDDGENCPVVEGSIAHLRCKLEALHRHGDHYVAVAEVTSWATTSEAEPLMFFSGRYPTLVD